MNDSRSGNDNQERSLIDKIAHAFSGEPRSHDDLLEVMEDAREREVLDDDAFNIISGALGVGDTQVREIMVPRPKMVVVRAEDSFEDNLEIIIRHGHSRYPVVGESPDDVAGILLTKDLLPALLNREQSVDLMPLLRPAKMVPESQRVNVLLREFREQRTHMAIVIDEYGGTAGLITIEDVLEEIVGEIEDEFDDDDSDRDIRKITDTEYVIRALTSVEDFNKLMSCDFPDEEFDTVGGLILHQLGHVPARDEVITIDRFEFRVINADNRQVHLLRMRDKEPR